MGHETHKTFRSLREASDVRGRLSEWTEESSLDIQSPKGRKKMLEAVFCLVSYVCSEADDQC